MEMREKLNQSGKNYLEIDLTSGEIEGLVRGKYPYIKKNISGKRYLVSVGIQEITKGAGYIFDYEEIAPRGPGRLSPYRPE